MKKLEKFYSPVIRKIRLKKFIRSLTSRKNSTNLKLKRNGNSKRISPDKIVAPPIFDMYRAEFHADVVDFVRKIESKVALYNNTKKKVHVCFRNTTYVSAAACLFLLASLESLNDSFPKTKYAVTKPPIKTSKKGEQHVVDSVLNRIGIYTSLGLKPREMKENPTVKCWEIIRGDLVDSENAGKLLETVTEKMGTNFNDLYRPLVEAMSNSVEHAYRKDLYNKKIMGSQNKWWCFASIMNNYFNLIICDLGVGIPNTLKLTQTEKVLSRLIEFVGKPLELDSEHIKASLQVKRTQTDLGHRGKGGTDLQTIIEDFNNSFLRILSNKGNYKYTNRKRVKPEVLWDAKNSINGTIVEWSVPLLNEGDIV